MDLYFLLAIVFPAVGILLYFCVIYKKRIRTLSEELEISRQETCSSKKLFQSLLESIPYYVYGKNLNTGSYIFCNQKYAKLWNLSEDEVLGKGTFDLFRKDEADLFQSISIEAETDKTEKSKIITFTLPDGICRKGHLFCKTFQQPGRETLLIGFVEDITKQEKNIQDLKELRALFNDILDNLPCHLFVRDYEHGNRFLFASSKLYQDYGAPVGSWINKTVTELFPPIIAKHFEDNDSIILETGKPMEITETLPLADGKLHTLLTLKSCHNSNTGPLIVGISLDVTERISDRKKLQVYADQQEILGKCLKTMLVEENMEQEMLLLLEKACLYLEGERCYLFRFDFEKMIVSPSYEYTKENVSPTLKNIQPQPILKNESWFKILQNQTPLLLRDMNSVEDRETFGSWTPYAVRDRISSLYAMGIFFENRLWGSLTIAYGCENKKVFTDSDIAFLQASANLIELVLERKQFSEKLKQSETEKEILLNAVPIPILLYKNDAGLICGNNAAMNLSHAKEDEILAHPYQDYRYFCGFASRPSECPVMRTSKDGQPHKMDITIGEHDYQVASYPVMQNGKMAYILKTLVDMTEYNSKEQILRDALKKAEGLAKQKNSFLATISHELRTPLNAVIGFAELLKQEKIPVHDIREYVAGINSAGAALLNLLDDLFELSTLEMEQLLFTKGPTDIRKMFSELQTIFSPEADKKQIALKMEFPSSLPILFLDEKHLRQILMNLIENAVKYTDKGEICISIEFQQNGGTGDLQIQVRDTGIGIAAEAQAIIFDPFVQQNPNRDPYTQKGLGLGLAISKRLAEQMNGSIQLNSTLGKGSVFTVHLNDVACNPAALIEQESSIQEDIEDFSHLKVLLIDDIPMNLKVLTAMLKKLDIQVQPADSAESGLEKLKTFRPDLVLTDIWMNGMNGHDFAAKIHENPNLKDVKVIAVTADSEINEKNSSGVFQGILLKPVSLEKLKMLLKKLIKKTDFV